MLGLPRFIENSVAELELRNRSMTDTRYTVWERALLFTPFFDLHHLLNVHVQLANKMGLKKKVWEPPNKPLHSNGLLNVFYKSTQS
jgi:hypothetical protein